jgi:TRAP transporter TAXI family solute receptor
MMKACGVWFLALSLSGAASLAHAAESAQPNRTPTWSGQSEPGTPTEEAAAPNNTTAAIGERQEMRARANMGLVGIISGGIDGTDLKAATDLQSVLDGTDDGLRMFPVAGKGSAQSVTDILFTRGVDIGIVQSDVLAEVKRKPPFPGVENFLQYICMLYDDEVHVLAAKDVNSVQDLAGKKVNVGPGGSGTALTASVIFGALAVAVEPTNFDQPLALEKLKRGEISALVYVVGKPARLFTDIEPTDNLHFLPVPSTDELRKTYMPAMLTPRDYPGLVAVEDRVSTLSVTSALVVYNWPQGTRRYNQVVRFVNAFFSHFHDLQAPPYHPKWQRIDLAAPLPGWTRFAPAEQRIRHAGLNEQDGPLRAGLETSIERSPGQRSPVPQQRDAKPEKDGQEAILKDFADYPRKEQREALFRDFVEYSRMLTRETTAAELSRPAAREQLFKDFVEYQKAQTRNARETKEDLQQQLAMSNGATATASH